MNIIGQRRPDNNGIFSHQDGATSLPLKHTTHWQTSARHIVGRFLESLDLLLLLLITALAALAPLTTVEIPAALQAGAGVMASLFIPGYALTCLLFPRSSSIDGLSRIALSFALSFATISLAALLLESAGAQVTGRTIVGTLTAATAVYMVLAVARRAATPVSERFAMRLPETSLRPHRKWPTPGRRVVLIAGVAGLLFTGSALSLLASYAQDEPTTEFALLNSSGEPEFYDRNYSAGETISLMLEVTNLETQQQRYVIRIRANGESIGEPIVLDLEDGDRWRELVQLALPASDRLIPVTFDLYRDAAGEGQEPYRTVRLMVASS